MRPSRFTLPDVALCALVGATALARLPFLRDTLHDDAYISLRYARHAASGAGLVFNPGERVEGFTNFLHTVALAMLARLGIELQAAALVLSLLPALALPVLVYRFGVRYGDVPGRAWALPAAVVTAVHPFLVAESVGGLETPLFALLVFWGFERAVAERRGLGRRGSAAAVLALATLVRPEGALAVALWAASVLFSGGPDRRRALVQGLGIAAALVVPLLVFRLVYYGDWLPNTFHAKVGWTWAQVERGADYVFDYGGKLFPIPVLLLAAVGASRGGWRTAAGLAVLVHAAAVAVLGGDYFPTGRFLIVLVPFVALLVQSGIAALARRAGSGWRAAAVATALVLVAAASSLVSETSRLGTRRWPSAFRSDFTARREIGRHFAATLPRDATIAVGTIGAIGWYSERRILDTFGLTNAAIGRQKVEWMGRASAGHEKGDAGLVLAARPLVIAFDRALVAPRELSHEEYLGRARSPTEQLLLEDPRLFEDYGLRTQQSPRGVLHYLERVPGR